MIVKVQIPIVPEGGQALIYDKDERHMGMMDQEALPESVRRAAKGGKAYFYAQLVGDSISFGAQAPAQDW